MKREINPSETSRAQAFNYWMKSPMPMVTITKTFDVTKIYIPSKQKGYKFNMLLCWHIGSYRHRNRLHCQPIFRRLLQLVSLVGQIPKALVPCNFAHLVSIPSRSNGRRRGGEVFGEITTGIKC